MFLRCLLVPTAPGLDPTRRLDAALRLGRRLHAHIGVAFIAPGPELVLAELAGTAPVSSATIAAIKEGMRAAAAEEGRRSRPGARGKACRSCPRWNGWMPPSPPGPSCPATSSAS